MKPTPRCDGLLVHQIDDEIVVYDANEHVAHRLNSTSAQVWEKLDGELSVGRIAGDLQIDEWVVELAIRQLAEAGLLENSHTNAVSRRAALRRFAAAAAAGVILPSLVSIPAPHPAAAQSSPISRTPPYHDETGRPRLRYGPPPRRRRKRRSDDRPNT